MVFYKDVQRCYRCREPPETPTETRPGLCSIIPQSDHARATIDSVRCIVCCGSDGVRDTCRMMENHPEQRRPGIFKSIVHTVGSYLRGQLVVMLIMMVLYGIGFAWTQVPLWGLAAFLCGLLHLIPIVGAVLAIAIPVAFTLVAGGGLQQVFHIAGVFIAAQLLETFVLTPRILGRELQLSPLIVFLSVLAGGMTFGVIGALVAPLVASIALLIWRARRVHDSADTRGVEG